VFACCSCTLPSLANGDSKHAVQLLRSADAADAAHWPVMAGPAAPNIVLTAACGGCRTLCCSCKCSSCCFKSAVCELKPGPVDRRPPSTLPPDDETGVASACNSMPQLWGSQLVIGGAAVALTARWVFVGPWCNAAQGCQAWKFSCRRLAVVAGWTAVANRQLPATEAALSCIPPLLEQLTSKVLMYLLQGN